MRIVKRKKKEKETREENETVEINWCKSERCLKKLKAIFQRFTVNGQEKLDENRMGVWMKLRWNPWGFEVQNSKGRSLKGFERTLRTRGFELKNSSSESEFKSTLNVSTPKVNLTNWGIIKTRHTRVKISNINWWSV